MSRSGRGQITGSLPWTGLRANGATGETGQPRRPPISHRQQIAQRRDADEARALFIARIEELRAGAADHERWRPYPAGPYTPIAELPF